MLLVLALAGLARPSYVLPAEQLGLRDPARLLEAPSPDLMGPSLSICSTSFWPATTDTNWVFIEPKSDHCLALKVRHSSC